jgi:hypothetical protein
MQFFEAPDNKISGGCKTSVGLSCQTISALVLESVCIPAGSDFLITDWVRL